MRENCAWKNWFALDMKGKIDVETAKQIEGDHVDALQGKPADNRCVICGHIWMPMRKVAKEWR